MKQGRISYYNNKWYRFAETVKKRDNHRCLKCGRGHNQVTLQVHHKFYMQGLEAWNYALSDCITLCKGCHARQHGIIEPNTGWILISVEDLGDLIGICQRKGCGTPIRYEHITYHPGWGYKSVGSTCVEHLTVEDQLKSGEVLKLFKKISDFVSESHWSKGITRKGTRFLFTTHSHHRIRIYGNENNYAFQILLKQKGIKWFAFKDIISAQSRELKRVKELAFVVLKGMTTTDYEQKLLLREIYKRIT